MKIFTLLGLAAVAMPAMAITPNAEGVYEIGNAAQLEEFAAIVNAGNRTANAVLTADIDMDGVKHTPIANKKEVSYKGTFDGQFHTISCLEMGSETEGENIGLFGVVGVGAVLRNTIIDDMSSFKGIDKVAAFAGSASDSEEGFATFSCLGNAANVAAYPFNDSAYRGAAIVGPSNDNVFFRFENCYNLGEVWAADGGVGAMSCYAPTAVCHNCFTVTNVKKRTAKGGKANPSPVGNIFITGVTDPTSEPWKFNFFFGAGPVYYPQVTLAKSDWLAADMENGKPWQGDATYGVYKVTQADWQDTGALCWFLNNCNEENPIWGQDLEMGDINPTFVPGKPVVVKEAGAFKFKNNGRNTTAAVNELNAETQAAPEGIYTIQGVRVNEATVPGLYIINGKKVIVK